MKKSRKTIFGIIFAFAPMLLAACSGSIRAGDSVDDDEDVVDAADADVADIHGEPDSGDIRTERDGDSTGDAVICGNGIVEGDEECDDGNETADDGCENDCTFSCHGDLDCLDPDDCNGAERCDAATHVCLDGPPPADGFVCESDPRSICLGGECAVSRCGDGFIDTGAGEFCDPPDGSRCSELCRWHCESGDDCPDDGNVCNGDEYCDTAVHECSHTHPPENGTPCLADPRRICIAGTCQESICGDRFADEVSGEECDDGRDGDPDDGCTDACAFSCHENADCEDANPCSTDTCYTTTSHECVHTASPNGTLCRPSAGYCDPEDYCDGAHLDCPINVLTSATTVCRASAGACDIAEYCTGSDAACPGDALLPPSTECRASAGACDVAEYCTGSDAACPGNALVPSMTECRASIGMCDIAEFCTGTSALCPENSFVPLGAPCDDGIFCTNPDACNEAGTCAGAPINWLYGVSAIAVDEYHNCALMNSGSVKCWGGNSYGELGDGSTTDSRVPVDVLGLSSGVSAIAAGVSFTCALMSTGGVKCWGYNYYGQLGDGTRTNRHVPVDVSGLSSGVSAIAAGHHYVCALMSTGGMKCWGRNGSGQLGDGTTTQRLTPTDVPSLSSGVSAIAASLGNTCALTTTGGMKCWGYNGYGEVGDGTTTQRLTPVDVSGLSSGVSAISVGRYYACALTDTGGMKCWGYNDYGVLGDGTTTNRYTPVDVSGLSSGVSAIAAGYYNTCALMSTGRMKCWGYNAYGQVGDGTTTQRLTPVDVSGLSAGVIAIAGGYAYTCALMSASLSTGGVKCWGRNNAGQLGDGTTAERHTPVNVLCE